MQRVRIQAIEQPASVTLVAWNVFQVQLPHDAAPTWHLSGFRKETSRGKVSSAISALDPKTCRCITRSGNVYELEGAPGSNADAMATRAQWLHINHVQHDRDATPEFLACMQHDAQS